MPSSSKAPEPTTTALGPAVSGERLRSLERQRTDLLRRIGKRKKELERLERDVSEAEQLVSTRLLPLYERLDQVNRDVFALLEKLLEGGLNKRAQRAVRDIFRMLVDEGVVSVPQGDQEGDPFASDPFDDDSDDENHGGARSERNWDDDRSSKAGSAFATEIPAGTNRESLKPLFRKLALELHPDRVQDEGEKEERTRLLKQIVRAYERGDAATLLHAEKAWLEQRHFEALDEAAQCAALEQLIAQLHEQHVGLRKAIHGLRDSDAVRLVTPGAGKPGRRSELERLERGMTHDLEQVTLLCDFVRAFEQKQLTFEQFLVGPELEFGGEVFDFDDLRQRAVEREDPRPQRRRGKGRGHGRS